MTFVHPHQLYTKFIINTGVTRLLSPLYIYVDEMFPISP